MNYTITLVDKITGRFHEEIYEHEELIKLGFDNEYLKKLTTEYSLVPGRFLTVEMLIAFTVYIRKNDLSKYELNLLVDILNNKRYSSYTKLLASNGFYVYRTEADGAFEYEDFLTPDEKHCITHVMEFNKKDKLISEHWEVTY